MKIVGQPRVRFGKVYVVNSLYTSSKSAVVDGLGAKANVLSENNVVKAGGTLAIDYGSYTAFESRNNSGKGNSKLGGTVFTPPCSISKESVGTVEAIVRKCAGATLEDPILTAIEDDFQLTGVRVSPNQFQQELRVDVQDNLIYQLIDLQGKVLMTGQGKAILNTSGLAPGFFFLKLQTGAGKSQTVKLQKTN